MLLITATYSQNLTGKMVDIDTETCGTKKQAARSLLDTCVDVAETLGASTEDFPTIDQLIEKLESGDFTLEIIPDEDDFEETMAVISAKLVD